MNKVKVFVDSDVVISSLLSAKGAAYLLLTSPQSDLDLFVSNVSKIELEIVCKRLEIKVSRLHALFKDGIEEVSIKADISSYNVYVNDSNDAHIVAGAVVAKAPFLVSYNQKHFKANLLRSDLNIILLTPAGLLQYLRSR